MLIGETLKIKIKITEYRLDCDNNMRLIKRFSTAVAINENRFVSSISSVSNFKSDFNLHIIFDLNFQTD